jgi:hypothetical protein
MPKKVAFLLLLAVMLIFKYGFFGPIVASLHVENTFDTQFWTPSGAEAILKSFGSALPAYYHLETSVDLLFPLIYSFTFAVAIAGLAPIARAPRVLALIPFVTAVFDYAENASVVTMILHYQAKEPLGIAATIGSLATGAKLVLFLTSFATTIVLAIVALIRSRAHAPVAVT